MQAKTTRAFRTISEAGTELGLQPHVLRFWESKFPDIRPVKRGGDRRYYRPEDIEFLRGIKTLLHDEKHPIKDVQKLIKKSGAERVAELGRSVQKASRERDVADLTLVPARILKRSETSPATIQTQIVPSPEPVAAAEPVETTNPAVKVSEPAPEPAPTDPSGLEDALASLERLKGRWDAFDSDS